MDLNFRKQILFDMARSHLSEKDPKFSLRIEVNLPSLMAKPIYFTFTKLDCKPNYNYINPIAPWEKKKIAVASYTEDSPAFL